MTAIEVNGVEVIAVQRWESPVKGMGGETLYFKQTVRLLLANEKEVAGCIWCDYTSEKATSVRPHLANCKVKKAAAALAASRGEDLVVPEPVLPPKPATLTEVVMDRKPPVVKAVPDWEAKRQASPQPAARAARPTRAAAATAQVDLGAVLQRLASVPELEAREQHLKAEVDRWRTEAMELRAFANGILTQLDGKPRRRNAKVEIPASLAKVI